MDAMDLVKEFLWAPIIAVVGWFLKDWKKSVDEELDLLHKRISAQNNYINNRLVKKDELKTLIDEMRYVRERVDEIADRTPRKE